MESLEFFSDIILFAALWPWGSKQPLTEMSTRRISWGQRGPVIKADILTTILCRCHEIWKPYLPGTTWVIPGL